MSRKYEGNKKEYSQIQQQEERMHKSTRTHENDGVDSVSLNEESIDVSSLLEAAKSPK